MAFELLKLFFLGVIVLLNEYSVLSSVVLHLDCFRLWTVKDHVVALLL